MPAETFVMGMNSVLYYGAAGAALASCNEVDNVKDLTLTLEAGEADVTTRGNSGWRATAATLRECSIEFQMQWKPGDTAFEAIKNAFLGGTTVALAALTGPVATEDSEGPFGDFSITSFSRNEALEESVKVDVTAKITTWNEWIEDGVENES